MTAVPMSLFKDGMMSKSDKATLCNHLGTTQCEMKETSLQVLEGSALSCSLTHFKSLANNM